MKKLKLIKIKRLVASFSVAMLLVSLFSFQPVTAALATGGPVLDGFNINPNDTTSTSATPNLWVHATDSQYDLVGCQYRYMTDLSGWTNWLDGTYYPDTTNEGNPIFGAGACISPTIDVTGAKSFSGEMRVTDTAGLSADTGVSTLPVIVTVAPVVTVNSVVTNNPNPTHLINGTVDQKDAPVFLTLFDSVSNFSYQAANNGDGTWSAYVTDYIPVGTYTIEVYAYDSHYFQSSTVSGSYVVDPNAPGDNTPPTATVTYAPATPTNQNVLASLNPSEPIYGPTTYTFTDNGSYTFNYTDLNGNSGSTVATVDWIDRTAPVISLVGPTDVSLVVGTVYVDQGAKAQDNYDGDISSKVVTTNPVNPNQAGDYTVTYNVSDQAGNAANSVTRKVHVSPRNISVTAQFKNKTYGQPDPALDFVYTGELMPGDYFSGALSRKPGETVGFYSIDQGTLTLGANYTITYTSANLEITKAPITITGDPKTKIVGQSDPALTYSITSGSLISGDVITGVLERVPGEDVGNYAINQGTLALNDNYNLTYIDGTFSIIPVTTTVETGSQSASIENPVAAAVVTKKIAQAVKGSKDTNGELKSGTTDQKQESKSDSKDFPWFGFSILLLFALFGLYLLYQQKPEWFAKLMFWQKPAPKVTPKKK